MSDLDKIYHNFSFDSTVLNYHMDENVEDLSIEGSGNPPILPLSGLGTTNGFIDDVYHNVPITEMFDPGFASFVLWNSHQCSGEVDLIYYPQNDGNVATQSPQGIAAGWSTVGNVRKNGSDWCVNKFRDMVVDSGNIAGINITGENVFNIPQVYENVIDPSVSTNPSMGRSIWVHSGMTEMLNPLIFDNNATTNPKRKFVDKWIALRLICRNRQNIVNLLSTKVGTRKYHRHDK